MRQETRNWLDQSKEDLSTAEANLQIKKYYAAAFFSQQCAEKALKALALETTRTLPRMHDVIRIGVAVNAPGAVQSSLVELNEDYTVARYPDAANGVPARAYDFAKADRKVLAAKRVLEWVEKCIEK